MNMPLPPNPVPTPPPYSSSNTGRNVGIGCAILFGAFLLIIILSIIGVTFLGDEVDDGTLGVTTTTEAEDEPDVGTTDEPTTTRRPTTTEALNSYDAAVDDGSLYDELVDEMGQEMADTVVETGEIVCENIDDFGVTRAMEISGAAMMGSTDEEIEFLSAAIYIGVGIVCPEHVDAVNEWAES